MALTYLTEKNYENLVGALTNNAIDSASSNPTSSLHYSSSTFPNLFNQSDTYTIEDSESFDNGKGDIAYWYNSCSTSFFCDINNLKS